LQNQKNRKRNPNPKGNKAMTQLETRINDLNHKLSLTEIEIDAWSSELELNESCSLDDTEIAIVVANLLQTLNA